MGFAEMATTSMFRASELTKTTEILGESRAIQDVLAEIRTLANTSATVLVTGETGVGKELIATYIHRESRRGSRPFVAVNCAGLPETLLESELFGHVKGSFTGAYRDKPGKFELANYGTLFLDEVGEMTQRMQGLLLRVLEKGEIQKVGADHLSARVDCRIVAATHRDLEAMVAQGAFRQDLYYRLNVMCVHVPPLRERLEDIPLLADFFLSRYSDRPRRFAPEARSALQAYAWPGNVRQLENVVQRLGISTSHDTITLAELPPEILREAHILPIPPRHERRRSVADVLRDHLRNGASFWTVVHEPYMRRDLTRADVRALIDKGLEEARGNYRALIRSFNVQPSEYNRFMNFLRKHECLLPFRDYR
jgi:transcriptional regulator with PAS, ATPase and Fis domain